MPRVRRRARRAVELSVWELLELEIGPDPAVGSVFVDREARIVAVDRARALRESWDDMDRWLWLGVPEEARTCRESGRPFRAPQTLPTGVTHHGGSDLRLVAPHPITHR